MGSPKPGDILLRGSLDAGYTLVDLTTGKPISEGFFTELRVALNAALDSGASSVWQENLDNRGRPLGPPTILIKPELKT
jgi:hypothetical protein